MRQIFLIAMILLLIENLAFADLVPATSEDLNDFDKQISASQASDSGKRNSTNSQSAAAKAKVQQKGQRQNFGQWVSEQRRQDDNNKPAGAGAAPDHSNAGGNSDARNSSPRFKDSGSSPGNSGNRKK